MSDNRVMTADELAEHLARLHRISLLRKVIAETERLVEAWRDELRALEAEAQP